MNGRETSEMSGLAAVNRQTDRSEKQSNTVWLWSSLARGIYIAEFVIFAAPVVIVLGYLAMMLGVVSGGAFLMTAPSVLLGEQGPGVQMAIFGAIGVGPTVFSLMVFWIFVGLGPIMFLCFLALVSASSEEARPLGLLLFSILPLLIPVTHLGIALHVGGAVLPSPDAHPLSRNS